MLLFVAWTGEWPLDRDPVLYNGLWRSSFVVFGPLFVSIPGLNLFPWQILLGALVPFALLRPGAFRRRSLVLDGAVVASFVSVALTFLWGFMRGGSAYQAYYQLWRFLAALVIGVILNSVLRRSSDLRALGVTVLLAALIRATLAIYFYWTIVRGRIDPPPPFMTNHDDSLLWVGGLLIAVAWAVASGRRKAWLAAAAVGALLLYAMVLNDRRLVWIELLLAFGVMYFLLPRGVRRRAGRWTLAAAPFVLAYVAVGWGRQEPVFAPVHAISSAGSVEDASSLARQEEIRNLLYTLNVAGNPLLGTGWGVAYLEATSVYTHFGTGFTAVPVPAAQLAAWRGRVRRLRRAVRHLARGPRDRVPGRVRAEGGPATRRPGRRDGERLPAPRVRRSVLRRHRLPVVHRQPPARRGDGLRGEALGLGRGAASRRASRCRGA